ncbi:membrane hypothetical protein [Frankia sp. AiPs1]|uniref:hypothetical protein n=1 Tax=Frankia sp. AiPa1 TaxID=573492 RepID=UPI00202B15E3|nr:hypothetical protein [Frankia sp. AiPa1]MCL9758878.1 hypothetical protein [Frankia sp. AiPa1]
MAACPECGEQGEGQFCARCGAEFGREQNGVLAVLNVLLRLPAWRTFLRAWWRMARRPVGHTIDIFEERNFRAAMEILEIIILISSLGLAGTFLRLSNLEQEFILPIYFAVNLAGISVVFSWLARRRSRVQRSSREILTMFILASAFSTPFALLLEILLWFGTPWSRILVVAVSSVLGVPAWIYMVRLWKYFWRLGAGSVVAFLVLASIIGQIPGTALLIPFGYNPLKVNQQLEDRQANRGYGNLSAQNYLLNAGPALPGFQLSGSVLQGPDSGAGELMAAVESQSGAPSHPPSPRATYQTVALYLAQESGMSVVSNVEIARTGNIQRDRMLVAADQTPAYVGEYFREALLQSERQNHPDQTATATVTGTAHRPAPPGITSVIHIDEDVLLNGQQIVIHYDVLFVLTGHVESITYISYPGSTDQRLEQGIAAQMVSDIEAHGT